MQDFVDMVENLTQEFADIGTRTVYMMKLYRTLHFLREGVGKFVEEYYSDNFSNDRLAKSFVNDEVGKAVFEILQGVYKVLEQSPEFPGSEYRKVHGIPIEEILGIDITVLGINTVVPKAGVVEDIPVTITLKDLDELRMAEFTAIGCMANTEELKVFVGEVIANSGGLNIDPLFKE